MRIDFSLKSYTEIIMKYWDLLNHEPELETDEVDDEYFIIKPYRVVIPEYGISIREGEWFVKDPCYVEETISDEEDFDSNGLAGYGFEMNDLAEIGFAGPVFEQNEGPWQSRGKVIIIYDSDEMALEKMLDYTTAGLEYTIGGYLKKSRAGACYSGDVPCFIETDEFMDENTAYMFWPADEEE